MADSVTYDQLLTLAAMAIGADRANLTTDENAILSAVPNEAVEEVANERRWPRIVAPYSFSTQTPYATGTVTANNGSPIVTLAGGTWPTWAPSAELIIGNDSTRYSVLSRDSGAQVTLTFNYAGTSGSGLSFQLLQNWVWLPTDFQLFPRGETIAYAPGVTYDPLIWTDIADIRGRRRANVTNWPSHCAIGGADASGAHAGQLRLELWPDINTTYNFVTSYRRRVATLANLSDSPDLPLELHGAVRDKCQMLAAERFLRALPTADRLAQRYAEKIEKAWRILADPAQGGSLQLADLRPGLRPANVKQGRNVVLDANYVP